MRSPKGWKMREPLYYASRNAEIARQYPEHGTLRAIGKRFNLTHERIRQIVSKQRRIAANRAARADKESG